MRKALKYIQTLPPVQYRGLFHPLATRRWGDFRVELKPFPDEGTVLEMEVRELHHIELSLACLSSLHNLLLHVQEKIFHLFGPGLLEDFLDKGEFAQVVDIA